MSYRAIGFDYGGVLHGEPGSVFNQRFCDLVGITIEEYHTAYFAHNRKMKSGELLSKETLWKLILTDLGKPEMLPQVMQFTAEYRKNKQINPDMMQLVDRLRSNGYKVGLFSNNTLEMAAQMRAEGIDTHFDAFVISAETGAAKPEPKAFEILCEQLGITMKELIYIDDSEKSLSTAPECGYTPVLFTDYKSLLAELSALGIDIT